MRNGSEGPCYPDNFFPQLNGDQRKIMSSCASMATSNPNTSQVAIVQGPPGTYNVYNTKKNWGTFGLKGGDFHPRKTLEWGFSDKKFQKKNSIVVPDLYRQRHVYFMNWVYYICITFQFSYISSYLFIK